MLAAAADRGELPGWARCDPDRRRHAARVARLLGSWADLLDLPPPGRRRWRAAGVLHDALRDADPSELEAAAGGLPDWPAPLLHAPACAEQLRREGVEDEPLLLAVEHHPVGHPDFGLLGDHLYLADFLEPGRSFEEDRRARLRDRMPEERDDVLVHVVRMRIGHLMSLRSRLLPETVRYWNRCVA